MTAAPFTLAQAARLYSDMPLGIKQEFRDFTAFYCVLQWFEGVHNIGAIPAALPSPAWCASVDAELAATAVEDAAVVDGDDLMDSLESFLEAQDALDNHEAMGINADDYFDLLSHRNSARRDLEAVIGATPNTAAVADGLERDGSLEQGS